MNGECWSVGGLLMGIGCIAYGLHFRFGHPSAWLKAHILSEYFNRNYPKLRRQSILGMIPAGLFFIFGGLAAIFEPFLSRVWYDALIVLSGVNMVAGVVMMYREPDWAKPEWFRQEERGRGLKR